MANHDHSSSSVPGDNQPLVPAGMHDNNLHGNQAMEIAQPYASPTFSRTPAVVTGGMDASWFYHSLRRRWMLATFMGLLIAASTGAALFKLFPESDTALARFLVSSESKNLLYQTDTSGDSRSFDIYKATQIALIRGSTVLQAALSNPNLQQVSVLREEPNPSMWLGEHLDVRFEGESELLSVSITLDEEREDLKTIIETICSAYLEEVVTKSRIERVKVLDALRQNYGQLQSQIRKKSEIYRSTSADLGIAEGGQFDPTVRMLFDELKTKMKTRAELEAQIRQIRLEYARWLAYKDNPDLKEQEIDAMVSQDPDIAMMDQELLYMKAELRDAEKRSNGRQTREIKSVQKKINMQQQQMASLKNTLREQIKAQIASTPDVERTIVTAEMQRQLGMAMQRLQETTEGRDIDKGDGVIVREMGIDELKEELASKAEGSTDLSILRAELTQLETVARDLAQRIQEWDLELQAPKRVQLVEPAYVMPGINKMQRYAITGIGSAAALLLTCLAVAYIEFLGRRLNGPDQLDEGLGIRVVGTLPALNAKRMMNPKHPLVAQLTESIDSVRTALMHDSTSKPRQVVLVTSPSAMEGRTTVASQLAASLARAGRRTLLIDGDLRRPALHSLFDVPLEDGLCELLRAEADVTDVVRPTHAEGLWLMTAGYCDADAVHAMATDQIQPIFEKLRTDYDFVIIDGAPVLGLSDSLMMGQHCDGALLSVLRDHTSVPSIYKASELLRGVGVRLVGSVVNGLTAKADRRVTHLQVASPKAARKQLESQPEEVAVATQPSTQVDDLDDLDFSDLSGDD